jgi:hypothetical protein
MMQMHNKMMHAHNGMTQSHNKMMHVHKIMWLLLALVAGCFGETVPSNDDAAYGLGADLLPVCSGNNDGVIELGELQFPLGLMVRYLANPAGTTVTVAPGGMNGGSATEWDLTSTAGEVHQLTLDAVGNQWFAKSFPGASYATITDLASGTLGIFQLTSSALLLMGYASPQPNQTLLVYDAPIATVHFPIRQGDSWVTGAKIVNGTFNGQPFASSDTYRISVDARGTAVLPFLSFQNTLRFHVELSQALPGGVAVTHQQYLFYHECYGELGRMVSNPGETNADFTSAAEFRRLAL